MSAITFLAFSWVIPSFNSLICLIDPPNAPSELLTSKTLGSTFLLTKDEFEKAKKKILN